MKNRREPFLLALGVIALLWYSLSTDGAQMAHAWFPEKQDSLLIVKNGIHKMRAVSETEVEHNRMKFREVGDPVQMDTERVVTWTEFDKQGRIVSVVDSFTASDHKDLKVKTQQYAYENNKLVRHSMKEWFESPANDTGKKAVRINRIEITTWNERFTLHHTEEEDAGQWNVQIDSTVFNTNGQKRLTYTYNSMGDSFVEEFTYDARARLKYRRLAMKLFWSPPWELESTTYRYNDDGTKLVIDSVWRNNPDMIAARKRAGDKRAPDYAWKVLMAAPATGTFDRLENRNEETFDAQEHLVLSRRWQQSSYMWEDYSYVYNKQGQLILHTEYRGDRPGGESIYGEPCTDSIWYEYKNGILYHEKVRRFCNTYHTAYDDTFQVKGVPVDPDRSFSFKYEHKEFGIVEVVTRYEHNQIVETTSFNEKGLMIKREFQKRFGDLTATTYAYFTW